MSYFGKVKFGKDSSFAEASDVSKALKEAGYEVKEQPENGRLYFDNGEGEE